MAFKLPGFGGKKTNIKGDMDRKYGLGDYARGGKKFEERMKPGESKFQYDVRMRRKRNKMADKSVMKTSEQLEGIDPKSEIQGTFSTAETYMVNTNDLRSTDTPANFGITSDMDFKTAFAQAGKGGAKRGEIFFWQDNPFLYDFKNEKTIIGPDGQPRVADDYKDYGK